MIKKVMDINFSHPSFIKFMDTSVKNITDNVNIENYFELPSKKKLGVEYVVYKTVLKTFTAKVKLNNYESEKIIEQLMLHCARNEEYTLATIFRNLKGNIGLFSEKKEYKKKIEIKKTVD